MLVSGKALKVTIYLSDTARHHGVPLHNSLLDFLFHRGIAGATVTKGLAGFGSKHRLHSAHILELSDHMPVKIECIDTREKVEAILPELQSRCTCGVIEIQEVDILVPAKS